ncbi:MAG: hypothetical protein WD990_12415 [Acidimicrobiia bacterium]
MSEHVESHRYEVLFLLDAPTALVEDLQKQWSQVGDSIVVTGGEGAWNCHIHTDDIGRIIELALGVGRPRAIRVTDLFDTGRSTPMMVPPAFEPYIEAAVAPVGVVAVVSGEGIAELFASLLVQGIVPAGRAMGPSVDEMLAVVDAAPASQVIVLPNNRNLVPVAEELDALTTKDVIVVPTRSIPQGVAAMMGYSTGEESLHDAAQTMSAAASSIISAEVNRALRDARVDGLGEIVRGDWIGGLDGTPIIADRDLWATMTKLLRRVMTAPIELITVYAGADADPAVTATIADWVASEYPRTVIDVRDGGQAEHPYLLSFE